MKSHGLDSDDTYNKKQHHSSQGGIRMKQAVNAHVEQQFLGVINNVSFDNKETYDSVEHIAYEIAIAGKEIPTQIIQSLQSLYERTVLRGELTERRWERLFEDLVERIDIDTFYIRPLDTEAFKDVARAINKYRKGE